jgi:hypothetical protein
MHFSHFAGGPGKEKNTFSDSSLASINMSSNPDIS